VWQWRKLQPKHGREQKVCPNSGAPTVAASASAFGQACAAAIRATLRTHICVHVPALAGAASRGQGQPPRAVRSHSP
jgi:hypothetical protein